jgi:hypothetical protein
MYTKYFHKRHKDEANRILSRGGVTTAYILDDNNVVVGYAQAMCHKHDNFSKQQGRVKAEGRLKSQRYFHQVTMPEQTFLELIAGK